MVQLLLVKPVGSGILAPKDVAKFAEVKRAALGYAEASVRTPSANGSIIVSPVALGAVKTREEGDALVRALTTALAGKVFEVVPLEYPDAIEVRWHETE